ncbi:aldehyde dehydrogenase family protein [Streptomyces sp. NPDC050263]|uniref:aldehyde dehydrogenase family protein n=1 Tax=Streptomyces sp. NPDC050263 TaxID=3155037 RepID=UPI00342579A3
MSGRSVRQSARLYDRPARARKSQEGKDDRQRARRHRYRGVTTCEPGSGSVYSCLPAGFRPSRGQCGSRQSPEIDAFIATYDRLVKTAYPDGPTSDDYTSIIDDKQHKILTDLMEDARAHGARIIEVGHRPGDADGRPHTLAPTVVLGVADDMRIAHEEIFGPILPIFGYRDIDDAITYANRWSG